MHYYDREQNGSVRWYDWIAVFWLTVMTWVIGQMAFTMPFVSMLEELDPEAAQQLNELSMAFMETGDAAVTGLGGILFLTGLIMAAIGYGIHYLGERGKSSQIVGLIGAVITFLGGGLYLAGMGEFGEANTILMSVIGLSPVAYLLMLLTFPAALVGLYLGWKIVHAMPLTKLHTAWSGFRWTRAAQAFAIMWAVLASYGLIATFIMGSPPEMVFDASRFLPFAFLSILLLPVQSATEEIVVRGYMNKGLTHWFGNKWVAFVLTSGLFTVLHLANPEAQAGAEAGNLPIVMSGYFFFGFAACLMVLIDDGLESAIGVHAGNNTFVAIFVNYENSVLPTPSVWQVQADPTSDSISTILILCVVLGLLYVTRTRRRALPTAGPTTDPSSL
ncbi:CPBP family intramembrane glutamic endopeptidase [uncultured Algimonas sp.]|uniref:CPBP family intramembrane glutamic endopeptidase n=1 Tax=uncultured Algimonas sp. TaxID=1547920 RepID=UPI002603E486|nr:CPBP family intramembrane glutamic endopeptidase [uncultured Algimonas sp.]